MPKKSKKSLKGGTQPKRTTSEPESYVSYFTRKTQCTGHQKPVHDIQSDMFGVAEWTDEGRNSIKQQEYREWLTNVGKRKNIENDCVCVKDKQCITNYCEKKKGKDYGKCSVRRDNRSLSSRISSRFKSLISQGRKKKKKSRKGKKKK